MITRLLLIPFMGKWHNYAHFTAGYIIVVSLPESWGDECAFGASVLATLGKESLDLFIDGLWTNTDVLYGLIGAVIGYGVRKLRHI